MRKSKNKSAAADASAARRFMPVHQDQMLDALASGLIVRGAWPPVLASEIDQYSLSSEAHGFDYGVVGLLELEPGAAAANEWQERAYALLSDFVALWLPSRQDVDEFESRLVAFGDTMPGALDIREGRGLFEAAQPAAAPAELELPFNAHPRGSGAAAEPVNGKTKAQSAQSVERIAGAVAMLRRRALDKPDAVGRLAALLAQANDRTGQAGSPLARFAGGVLAVASPGASQVETRLLEQAAALLLGMPASDGIDPTGFAGKLKEEVSGRYPGGPEAQAAEGLQEIVRRLLANQLELTPAKIDDSGEVVRRGLMIFLLAHEPDRLLRWFAARPGVGEGVALVASFLSGLFAGLGRLSADIKGPGREAFLSTAMLGHQVAAGATDAAAAAQWAPDGTHVRRIVVSGMEFVRTTEAPGEAAREFLRQAGSAELSAIVHADSGALSIAVPGQEGATIDVVIGPSRWVPRGPDVAALCLPARHAGRGQLPRPLLEDLLSPGIAPAWATLGDGPGKVSIWAEADLAMPDSVSAAVALVQSRASALGLQLDVAVPPTARRRATTGKVMAKDANGA